MYKRAHFALWHNRVLNFQFSNQDARVMAPQRYDTSEKMSGTDAEIIQWRNLLQRVANEGRTGLKDLQAEHPSRRMGRTSAEGFAEALLKEEGLEDVTAFLAGSVSSRPEG